jgi:hypothetical protein
MLGYHTIDQMKLYQILATLLMLQILVFLPPIKLYSDSFNQKYPIIYPRFDVATYGEKVLSLASMGGIGPVVFLRQDAVGVVISDLDIRWEYHYSAVYLGNTLLDILLMGLVISAYRIENSVTSLTLAKIRRGLGHLGMSARARVNYPPTF